MRLRDKETAAIVIEARRLDNGGCRDAALRHLVEHDMGGWEGNGHASALRILDYQTFRYVDCVPREHPLWREWRAEEDVAIASRREARKHLPTLMERVGGNCEWCGKSVSGRDATVDHIDGDKANNALDNLALLCRSCNARKSNGSLDRLARVEEANERRRARNEEEARAFGYSSYAAMLAECDCHGHGCPPYCQGCEFCGHLGHPPTRDICCPNWISLAYEEKVCDEPKCREAGECLWETEG